MTFPLIIPEIRITEHEAVDMVKPADYQTERDYVDALWKARKLLILRAECIHEGKTMGCDYTIDKRQMESYQGEADIKRDIALRLAMEIANRIAG